MSVYKKISIDITPAQLRKAHAGKQIQLSAAQVGGSAQSFYVHPENHKKITMAKKKGTGTRIWIGSGAIEHDLMNGGSVWSWLKKAGKDVYKFGRDNWSIIKPLASKIADQAVPALATAFGQPQYATAARGALKQLTGVGVRYGKGTPEMKAHMAAVRAKKRTGGSFRL